MKKIIKLYQHIGKYLESKEYIKLDEDLELEFVYNSPKNANVYVYINNGFENKKHLLKDNQIVINKDFIKFGKLQIKVDVFVSGQVVQTFVCEDLLIFEDKNIIYSIPEIEEYKKVVNQYIEKTDKLQNDYNKLAKLVSGLCNINLKVGDKHE